MNCYWSCLLIWIGLLLAVNSTPVLLKEKLKTKLEIDLKQFVNKNRESYYTVVDTTNMTSVDAEDELILAFVMYRHGNRAPTNFFLSSSQIDHTNWAGYTPLHLTQKGKASSFKLGKVLRERYVDQLNFVSSFYNLRQNYFLSSSVDRTLMSAQLQSEGMYPPSDFQTFDPNLKWSPIPIRSISTENDYLLNYYEADCPRLKKLMTAIQMSDTWKEIDDSLNIIKPSLSTVLNTNLSLANLYQVNEFVEYSKLEFGVEYQWTSIELNKLIQNQTNLANQLYFFDNSTEFKYLTAGPLFTEILSHIVNKVNSIEKEKLLEAVEKYNYTFTNDTKNKQITDTVFKSNIPFNKERKMYFFSTHDYILQSFMNLLSIPWRHVNFSDALIVELYRTQQDYYVKLLYKNDTDQYIPLIMAPCNSDQCLLSDFIKHFKMFIVDNIRLSCQLSQLGSVSNTERIVIWSILVFYSLSVTVVLVTQIIRFKFSKRQHPEQPYEKLPFEDQLES